MVASSIYWVEGLARLMKGTHTGEDVGGVVAVKHTKGGLGTRVSGQERCAGGGDGGLQKGSAIHQILSERVAVSIPSGKITALAVLG